MFASCAGTPRVRIMFAAAAIGAALVLAGCSSTPAAAPPAGSPSVAAGAVVGTANTSLGAILVDRSGKTIYTFATDTPGQSTCVGACVSYWPPVVAPSATPAPVTGVSGTLGSIKRTDGTLQLTINGLPAYTYAADSGPGATSGQGMNSQGGLWWVVNPSGVSVTSGPAPSASKSTSGGGWA